MDSRGFIKTSIFCIIILISIFLIFTFSQVSSSDLKEQYVLGDIVKIDLKYLSDYEVKIITPTENYFKKGSNEDFIFKPTESGDYRLIIQSQDSKKTIEFTVLPENLIPLEDLTNSSDHPIQNDKSSFFQENKSSSIPKTPVLINDSQIEVDKPVKWIKLIDTDTASTIEIPKVSENISAYKEDTIEPISVSEEITIIDSIAQLFNLGPSIKKVSLEKNQGNAVLVYFTPSPRKIETSISKTKKLVKLESPANLHYTNVKAISLIDEVTPITRKERISVYWIEEDIYMPVTVYDTNNNGLIDRVEWFVPHLSEQNFIIIQITSAMHLNDNRTYIEDIFPELKAKDDFWKLIPENDFIRVTFERNLTNVNDITLVARSNSTNATVEVYEKDKSDLLATFETIFDKNTYRILLTNLLGIQDTFDLKIINGWIDFDFIIDPQAQPSGSTELRPQTCSRQENQSSQNTFNLACLGTYPSSCPSDRMSCNDNVNETATSIRVTGGGAYSGFAGVKIMVNNTGITTCESVGDVFLCYEFWGESVNQHSCTVGVDNGGDNTFVDHTLACANSAPGVTCINVTADEAWTCSNFFGVSGVKATAKAQAQQTGGTGTSSWNFDVLFFNVTFTVPRPNIRIISPLNGSTISDVTPYLNITINGTASSLWYSFDSGRTNSTICSSANCIGNFSSTLYLREGSFNLTAYINNSANELFSNFSSFNIDMNFTYDDTFNDNTSIVVYNNVSWLLGNFTFQGFNYFEKYFKEAESLSLSGGYVSSSNCVCTSPSSGNCARHEGSIGAQGNVTLTSFPNVTGEYNLTFRYCDENDDPNVDSYKVFQNGQQISSFTTTAGGISQWKTYSILVNISNNDQIDLGCTRGSANTWCRIDLLNITGTGKGLTNGSIMSYPINTSSLITQITNISWTESGTDSENNITIQISADNGANWYTAANGQGLSNFQSGTNLLYRALFRTYQARNISLLDMMIKWSNVTIPIVITINSPEHSSRVQDVTPLLNITASGYANTIWYTLNGGITNLTFCTSCTGIQSKFLFLRESNFTVKVYANNSAGETSMNYTSFIVDMNFTYNDTFDDNSSLLIYNNVSYNFGNISFNPNRSLLYDTFDDNSYTDNSPVTWIPVSDSGTCLWEIISGILTESSNCNDNNRDTTALGSFIYPNNTFYTDFNFSTTLRASDNDGMGVMFRYVNRTNYYRIHFDGTSNYRRLEKMVNGVVTVLDEDLLIDGGLTEGFWHNLTLTAVGSDIKVYLDNNYVLNATDSTFLNGTFALYSWGMGEGISYGADFNYAKVDDLSTRIGSVTSYPINTSSQIVEILNVSWHEDNTNSENNITIQISADNGANWFTAENNQGISTITSGSNLLYRALFSSLYTSKISLLDMYITWSNSTSPKVNITFPANTTYNYLVSSLNYVSQAVSSCKYSLNNGQTNTSITCGQNVTGLTPVQGTNTWTVYGSSGSIEVSSSKTFYVDSIKPLIYLNYPSTGQILNSDSLNLSWNASDNLAQQISCNVTIDSLLKASNINVTNGSLGSYIISGLSSGTHYWNVTCWDDAFNVNISETRSFIISLQTKIYQIIKGYGTTNGMQTDITISPPLQNITKAFHFISYNHTQENLHAATFKASELINETTLRIYGGTSSAALDFNYVIIEFNSSSPLNVQRSTKTIDGGQSFPQNDTIPLSINLSESFILQEGHAHYGLDSGTGSEEFERVRLVNETIWELDIGTAPNSGPQNNTVEIIDWNDPDFIKRVQHGLATIPATSLNINITPPFSVVPNNTLVFISMMEGTGLAQNEPPSETGLFATVHQNGDIIIEREVAGPELLISYQLVEFKSGKAKVQHLTVDTASGVASENKTITSVNENKSAAFGTVSVPFGFSSARSSSTTNGAFDRNMFRIILQNKTTVQVIRGDPTGTAKLGVQVWEVIEGLTISNVLATSINSSSERITWDTDSLANSTVKYGTSLDLPLRADNSTLTIAHLVNIHGLLSSTLYYFNVTSCSADACDESGPYNFTTTSGDFAPQVNLTYPQRNYIQNYSTIVLYYNTTDANNNFANSTLIINGLFNITNQSEIRNGEINNFTLFLSDGYYTWTVNVTDTTSYESTDNVWRNFTIDTRQPSIFLHNPLPDQLFTTSNIMFNFTTTDLLDNNLTCNLTIDSVVVRSNIPSFNNTPTNLTRTVSVGNHLWNISCWDDAGNVNVSKTQNFSISDSPPSIELITTNYKWFNSSTAILLFNVTDNNNLANCSLLINGGYNQTNQSEVRNGEINNFTLVDWSDGSYNWTINCTDDGLLTDQKPERTFYIDTTKPVIYLNKPDNDSASNTSNVNFNFSVFDNLDTQLSCNLSINERLITPIVAQNGSGTIQAVTGLTDGMKIWNVTCMDEAGNINNSINWQVNITERPQIYLQTQNNKVFNSTSFNLSYLPMDNTNLSRCDLYINGIYNQTNNSLVRNNQQNNFTVDLNDGTYLWSVGCYDYANLFNISSNRSFTIDSLPPTIQLFEPIDGELLFSSTVYFNFTVTDFIDNPIECNITVNGQTVRNLDVNNGSNNYEGINFASGGLKYWNITCWDDARNTNISVTRNFTLSFAPIITLNNPPMNHIQNDSIISLFYQAADDNNNIANSTLIINGRFNMTNQSGISTEDINNFTLFLNDGYYTWTVNITDTTNLFGTYLPWRNFTIDTTPPNITLNTPENNSIKTWNNVTFNFTVVDNLAPIVSCDLYINNNLEMSNINATTKDTLVYITKPDGEYNWNLSCIDWANNSAMAYIHNFSIEAPPNVTLVYPTINNVTNKSNVEFYYIPSDAIGFTNCSLIIDDQVNKTINEPDNGIMNQFTVDNILEGFHNWTVECIDASPDFNPYRPKVRNLTVDRTHPIINLFNPLNDSFTLRTVTFNFSAIDNLDNLLNCSLYIDGLINKTGFEVINDTQKLITVYSVPLGLHTWNLSCFDDANNLNWSYTWQFNVTLPDLAINQSDLVLNNSNPIEDEMITLNLTVHNLANVTVYNITIQFLNGTNSATASLIQANRTISQLGGLSSQTVAVDYTVRTFGGSYIFAYIDPPVTNSGSIQELNESNNEVNRTITVGSWGFASGRINSESTYNLDDFDNNSLIKWSVVNFSYGNIYATDLESIITWTSLQAIGINKSGSNSTSDFSDIDSLLEMSTYPDSVYQVYTNAGLRKNVSSLVLFGKLLNEIPIAESINNTNFTTGILWDTTKDTNGEFNILDKEDILFVTKVSPGMQGSSAVNDYEIRIPAKLRQYYTADSSRVAFYTELR